MPHKCVWKLAVAGGHHPCVGCSDGSLQAIYKCACGAYTSRQVSNPPANAELIPGGLFGGPTGVIMLLQRADLAARGAVGGEETG